MPGSRRRREAAARLEEEVTAFGEALAAHTFSPGRPGTPDGAVGDYERALDAYEQARRNPRGRRGDEEGALRALDEGRHALACLDARLAGKPLPKRLPLCFFDPRHGRAVREVPWTPVGGAGRLVPVCAADEVRLAEGVGPIASGTGQLAPAQPVPEPPVAAPGPPGAPPVAPPAGKPRW
ncbi:hypothetical protein U9R90_36005, partial [Streptomyces sp. E11-3]